MVDGRAIRAGSSCLKKKMFSYLKVRVQDVHL